jgi:hypothetical protein
MSVKCPKCHHANPDDTLFCGKCGTRLPSDEKIEFTKTMETAKEELTSGSAIASRYEIIEKLGEGGMGVVYRVGTRNSKRYWSRNSPGSTPKRCERFLTLLKDADAGAAEVEETKKRLALLRSRKIRFWLTKYFFRISL